MPFHAFSILWPFREERQSLVDDALQLWNGHPDVPLYPKVRKPSRQVSWNGQMPGQGTLSTVDRLVGRWCSGDCQFWKI